MMNHNSPAFVSLLSMLATVASADLCIKHRSHTDEFYDSGVSTPAVDRESEVWIGPDQLAYISSVFHLVVDAKRNMFTFANRRDSTFVQAELPFEWSKFVPEQLVGLLAQYRTHGAVEYTNDQMKLKEWDCCSYNMTSWIDTEGGRYNERESKFWVTRDLPVDWARYRAMNIHMLKATNYDDSLVVTLDEIVGFIVRMDTERFGNGFSVKSFQEVVEVEEAEPRTDVYSLPTYFRKKEFLSMADLGG